VIEAPGVVERIDGDSAWVRLTEIQGGCGRCHEPGGCGGARIAHAFGSPNDVFEVRTASSVNVGQSVLLVADEGAALSAAVLSYGVPTMAVLACVGVGTWVAGEAGALVGLVSSLIASAVVVRRISQLRGWTRRLDVSMRPLVSCDVTQVK